ncbi:hypothetical protein ST27_24130 [Xanthomonas phaseoli pv. phaseoli]|nr:hypothetical protein ST27_24130 [Xanthomonas phaseoli pv. phaseoli]
MHAQASILVGRLDASMGRASDAHSERMSASLANLASEHGLERIDHVLLSNQTPRAAAGATVFVVQGEPSNPAHLRARVIPPPISRRQKWNFLVPFPEEVP